MRSSRRRLVVAAVGFAVLAAALVALRGAGAWLVAADAMAPGDAIFVLDGFTPARELEAAALYREGLAPRVVVANARGETPDDVRSMAGIATPQAASVRVLAHVGVPESAIVRLSERVENTRQELAADFAYARDHGFRRVILVSSPSHLRRIRIIWGARYEATIPALLRATRYETYDARHWWRSRHGLEWTAHELLGIVHFWLGSPIPTFAERG